MASVFRKQFTQAIPKTAELFVDKDGIEYAKLKPSRSGKSKKSRIVSAMSEPVPCTCAYYFALPPQVTPSCVGNGSSTISIFLSENMTGAHSDLTRSTR